MNEVELILESKSPLSEGPCWDERKQNLIWIDIVAKEAHFYDPSSAHHRIISLDLMPGCIVQRKSGGYVLALEDGFYHLDAETEKLTLLTETESDIPTNRFNDGKCDPAGRFLAGTMAKDAKPPSGSLYCLEKDLQVRKLISGVTVSNGLTWSPDYKTFYYIDSPTRKVVAYDYDIESGIIKNPRVVITINFPKGDPDGMTSDNEGMLWIAIWGGAQMTRWNPTTGKLIQSIPIPAYQVSSCIFGGKDLNELYITTARCALEPDIEKKYPLSGSLFRYQTDTRGMKCFEFSG